MAISVTKVDVIDPPVTKVFTYDGSGNLSTITSTYADGRVVTKTFTYTLGVLDTIVVS